VSPEAARLAAAQAKADAVIAAVADLPDARPMLRVSVTDLVTGQRLATGFVHYDTGSAPVLRLVGGAS
jgi:hypothetical protein